MEPLKDYIGDGVYIEWTGHDFKLSTQRFERDDPYTDVIYLEPDMIQAIVNFQKRVNQAKGV